MIPELRTNLVSRIGQYVPLKKVSAHEWAGACPVCGGKDRFRVNDQKGFFCRVCHGEPGSTGHWGDFGDFTSMAFGWTLKDTLKSIGADRRLSPDELAKLESSRKQVEAEQRAEEERKQAEVHDRLTRYPEWRTYAENLRTNPAARDLWHKRGLSDEWIDYYAVGYNPSRRFAHEDTFFESPSLTIPYFRPVWKPDQEFDHWHCIGLQHRLLAANPPGGKYRPHLAGAGKHLFFAALHQTQPGNHLLLLEGEIKTMVTWANLWIGDTLLAPLWTVIGIPGKGWKAEWIEAFRQAKEVRICLDPDAQESAKRLAQAIGPQAKNILLPDKIDDLINLGVLDTEKLLNVLEL